MLRLASVLTFLLFFVPSAAQTVEQEFKTKLERAGNENRTIQCDFTQVKKIRNIRDAVRSAGTFYYDNSGLMALHYTTPAGDKVLMNGDRFTIVASGRKIDADGSSNPMMAQLSYMMQACMSGDLSKLGRGWEMELESIPEGYRVTIRPVDRRVKRYIASMTLCFDGSNLTLNSLRIDETAGGYTEYAFHGKVMNQPIDKSYFQAE